MEENGNVPGGSDPFVIGGDDFSNSLPPKRPCDCLKNGLMTATLSMSILLLFYVFFSIYFLNDLEKRSIAYDEAISLSENWLDSLNFDAQTLVREDRITHDEYVEIKAVLSEFNGSVISIRVFNNTLISLLAGTKINNGLNILYCRFMAGVVDGNLQRLLEREAKLDEILNEFKKRDGKKQECFLFQKSPYFLTA